MNPLILILITSQVNYNKNRGTYRGHTNNTVLCHGLIQEEITLNIDKQNFKFIYLFYLCSIESRSIYRKPITGGSHVRDFGCLRFPGHGKGVRALNKIREHNYYYFFIHRKKSIYYYYFFRF